jgi:hypothetical protein
MSLKKGPPWKAKAFLYIAMNSVVEQIGISI